MIRIRGAAIVAGLAILLGGALAHAQEITGRVTGRVTDVDSGQPLPGVTVIIQGPQGEDATITDSRGQYLFATLPVGNYALSFYTSGTTATASARQENVRVSADKVVRVNAKLSASAAPAETYVIKRRAPAVDVGTTRSGVTLDPEFLNQVPVGRTFSEVVEKAPGAFFDRSGGVSIAGASGIENTYIVDGVNVTGMDVGEVTSNPVVNFVKEISINRGGYAAEFGGAMGGVISVVTPSGSNEFHGSAFSYWSPYWMAGSETPVVREGQALVGQRKPDYALNIGAEVSGPIIKNKLFFWAGFAPSWQRTHFWRTVNADLNADGSPETAVYRNRTNELGQVYNYAAKIEYVLMPEHRLTLGISGTPRQYRGLSLSHAFGDNPANAEPGWAEQLQTTVTTDVTARWSSKFFNRSWLVDAVFALHREDYKDRSPYAERNDTYNQIEWWGANLYDVERNITACAPTPDNPRPCPIDNYHSGGYGLIKDYVGHRWMGALKSTHLFDAGGRHELKYGAQLELNLFDQIRYYSGPMGQRGLVQNYAATPYDPAHSVVWTLFSLPEGESLPVVAGRAVDPSRPYDALGAAPYYKDALEASVKNITQAYFVQDSYSPLPNLTLNAGVRLDMQKLYDFRNEPFLNLSNWAPRVGLIYDPTNEGRSRAYAHYGQFYEAIPMNIAARYFGGEGVLNSYYYGDPGCPTPGTWTAPGEWTSCRQPTAVQPWNNGANYPVQPGIKGQFQHEIVAGYDHELFEDFTVGVEYMRRWLGNIIEDGTGADFTFVLANPGNVPVSALEELDRKIAASTDQNEIATLSSARANLEALGKEPKPTRTYNALTLRAAKRFSKSWMVQASYTYSRLFGNYNGLYDPDNNYFAPNGNNAYDTQDVMVNRFGPLANDRPHLGRVDGFYQFQVGRGSIITGLGFFARSGQPKNYNAALIPGQQLIFLLPRGAGGRTPTVTQFDLKVAYRMPLAKGAAFEVFIDIFNVLNQKTTLRTDDDYTYDMAAPIENGTVSDLVYAKNAFGAPLSRNRYFGAATAYQAPIRGRLGARLTF